MAEETGAAVVTPVVTPVVAPAAAVDTTQIMSQVAEAIKAGLTDLGKQATEAKTAQEAAAAAETQRGTINPAFAEMLRPVLEPTIRAAGDAVAQAAQAQDAMMFYMDSKNAEAMTYRDKIEDVVQTQLKKGNVVNRKDAWNWLRGGELYETLQKGRDTVRVEKEAEASRAAAVGAGSPRQINLSKPIEGMNSSELGEALKGVSF